MNPVTHDFLASRLELGDRLLAGRDVMTTPQDLPGRYGRVVHALDRVLQALGCESVVAGGWAVWRHGYVGRVTQDVDVVIPAGWLGEFLRLAPLSGFETLSGPEGRWPKLRHKETSIEVDVLPEGGRPGTAAKPAPTTIPHPVDLGASGATLRYISLPGLVELKLAAGRARDLGDIVELIHANLDALGVIRDRLAAVHPSYLEHFDQLVIQAAEEREF